MAIEKPTPSRRAFIRAAIAVALAYAAIFLFFGLFARGPVAP